MAGDTRTVRVVVTGDSSSARHAIRSLQGEVSATEKHFGGLGTAMAVWAKRGAVALGAVAMGAGVLGFKTAMVYEQSEMAFTTMLGNGEKAKKFMKELRTFADFTPFGMKDLLQSTQMLMAMGFEANKVIPTLTAVGDAVAGMGGGGEKIQFVTRALGQMLAKGKVSGEELRQLNEQGIKAQQMLADNYGKTVPEISKMVEKGLIPAKKAVDMIIDGMENGTKSVKGFGGMMEKQSTTVGGRMSTLKDKIEGGLGDLWKSHFPAIGNAIKGATDQVDGFFKGLIEAKGPAEGVTGPLNTLALGIRALFDAFKDGDVTSDGFVGMMERLGNVLRWVWEKVKALGDLYKQHKDTVNTFIGVLLGLVVGFKAVLGVITLVQIAFALLTSPVVIVIGVLALLITWLVRTYKTNEEFRQKVDAAWEAIKKAAIWAWEKVLRPVFKALGAVIGRLIENWGSFKKGVSDAWTIISSVIKFGWNKVISPVFNGIKTGIGAVKSAFDTAKRGITSAWDGIKAAVGKPIQWVINTIIRDGIISKFNWIADKVGIDPLKFAGVNWKFASGGVLPGYSPGRDIHSFVGPAGRLDLSGGEAIMRPEFTRMVGGPAGVARLNRLARYGFADGGVWGSVKDAASAVWDAVSDPMKVLRGFISRIGGSTFVHSMAGGLVKKVVGGMVDKIKDAFGSANNWGGSASGTGGSVQRWSGTVMRVLMELRQPLSLLPAVLRRIAMESGGNPNAINLWDSNARAGIPSQGLMQTVPGTFAAYAGPYRGLGITNPLASIYAGLNYALARYGSIGAIDPRVRPMGYDSGGYLQPGLTLAYNGTGRPEPVGWQDRGGITVNVTVEGNVTTERDLVKAITLGVRDELLRHASRNGGRTGLPR